jgi:hypothetical protein
MKREKWERQVGWLVVVALIEALPLFFPFFLSLFPFSFLFSLHLGRSSTGALRFFPEKPVFLLGGVCPPAATMLERFRDASTIPRIPQQGG